MNEKLGPEDIQLNITQQKGLPHSATTRAAT